MGNKEIVRYPIGKGPQGWALHKALSLAKDTMGG